MHDSVFAKPFECLGMQAGSSASSTGRNPFASHHAGNVFGLIGQLAVCFVAIYIAFEKDMARTSDRRPQPLIAMPAA